jgi:hypothetical protein
MPTMQANSSYTSKMLLLVRSSRSLLISIPWIMDCRQARPSMIHDDPGFRWVQAGGRKVQPSWLDSDPGMTR